MFRHVSATTAGPRSGVLLTLFLTATALQAAIEVFHAQNIPSFNEYGLASRLAEVAVFSAAIASLGQAAGRVPLRRALADFLAIVIFTLSAATVFAVAMMLLTGKTDAASGYSAYVWIAFWAIACAWMLAAFWRAGEKLWRGRLRLAGARFVAAALLPVFLVPHQPIFYDDYSGFDTVDIWYWSRRALAELQPEEAPDEAYSVPAAIDVEGVFHRQDALLASTLAGVLPASGNDPQYFFLGLAPSSAQDVFRKEVRGAQSLFDRKFATRGHSALLINSEETLETVALASGSNLETALGVIGRLMNRDRDVLVLFISSHGAKGYISVDLRGFPLNGMTPVSLSAALAKSRIKNRVLIISACHSGSFIPALAGPDTLIMTAAHADRTSFGCANGRDWTYFGDALFNHAFTVETSFEKAFAKARTQIMEWEQEQKLAPSDPQIFVGAAIRKTLENMPVPRAAPNIAEDRANTSQAGRN